MFVALVLGLAVVAHFGVGRRAGPRGLAHEQTGSHQPPVVTSMERARAEIRKARRIDTLMRTLHRRGQFDGSLIVAQSGAVIYRNAFGVANVATQERFKPTTVSCIASVSKQFTAMAIMILAERRALGYDDTISAVVPELSRYARGVKIRHLLNHTSGIPDVGDLGVDHPGLTNDEVLRTLVKQDSLTSRPGTTYRYSNTGYVLLAAIVERVTGQRFRDFLAEHIFEPVGMQSTYVYDGTAPHGREVAMAYDEFGKPDGYADLTTGDGGMFSSVDDLLKWDRALHGESLVRATTLASAFDPPVLSDGKSTYGFGWNVREEEGEKVLWHTGRTGGYRAFIERRPAERVSIIMLTNHGNTDRVAIARAIVNILHDKPYELPKQSIAGAMFAATAEPGLVPSGELVLLLAWLCAPWLAVALLAQLAFLRRRGALARGRRGRAAAAAAGTVALTLMVAGALLAALPPRLLPRSPLPDSWPSLPPLRFPPGIVAAAVAAAAFGAWAGRGRRVPSRPAI